MTMAKHDWIPSTLGHGDAMCRFCKITNREAAAIGQWECLSVPVPAETGTHSPDNPPPGTVGASLQPYGRGKRLLPGKPQVVDYAGTKTARLNPAQPAKLCEDEGCPQHGTPHVCVDPPMVEQLARRFETYADDNDAIASRRRLTITDARETKTVAHTFRNSAKELREAMTAKNKAKYQVEVINIIDAYVDARRAGAPPDKDKLALDIVTIFMGPAVGS